MFESEAEMEWRNDLFEQIMSDSDLLREVIEKDFAEISDEVAMMVIAPSNRKQYWADKIDKLVTQLVNNYVIARCEEKKNEPHIK